ncbi:NADPH-dependent FMN reductase [Mucilaginibacter sp.]|uniref:NADPH-dependent FMN reductase n=1 Tax=Mucilaginibacter sp. TaxID=1882438 RepID=UPI002625F06A|nr:NADPH-dependent FMN reductase [Mucilaginibacter sp.]MDB5030401.1 azr 2 [Mucilaginibacter sp.]
MKNILAISGSLRQGSSNHSILKFLGSIVPADIEYTIYNDLAQIPAFDPGFDTDNPPASVASLRQLLAKTDGLIICTPEYAFGVPGSLKNMLDWMVSSSTLVDKPVALITASLGGEHAHASLLLTLGALSANIVDDATLLIQFVRSKIDADGNVKDEETVKNLQKVSSSFLNKLTN